MASELELLAIIEAECASIFEQPPLAVVQENWNAPGSGVIEILDVVRDAHDFTGARNRQNQVNDFANPEVIVQQIAVDKSADSQWPSVVAQRVEIAAHDHGPRQGVNLGQHIIHLSTPAFGPTVVFEVRANHRYNAAGRGRNIELHDQGKTSASPDLPFYAFIE